MLQERDEVVMRKRKERKEAVHPSCIGRADPQQSLAQLGNTLGQDLLLV
jgi:hypothetical protein